MQLQRDGCQRDARGRQSPGPCERRVQNTPLSGEVVLLTLRDAPRLPLEVDRNDGILLQNKVCSLELICEEEWRQ